MMRKWRKRKRYRKFKTKWHRKIAKACPWIRQQTVVAPIDNNWELLSRALEENAQEFDILLDTIWAAYSGQWSDYCDTPIGRMVFARIQASSDHSIEKEDIYNRLLLVWYDGIRRYEARKPPIPFDNYICRMSLWELKSWLRKYNKMELQRNVPLYCKVDITDFPKLDLHFVSRGTEYPILNKLSLFERYLLYLRFTQEESDAEIGRLLSVDAQTIGQKIDAIIGKLKAGFSRQADHQDQTTVLH